MILNRLSFSTTCRIPSNILHAVHQFLTKTHDEGPLLQLLLPESETEFIGTDVKTGFTSGRSSEYLGDGVFDQDPWWDQFFRVKKTISIEPSTVLESHSLKSLFGIP